MSVQRKSVRYSSARRAGQGRLAPALSVLLASTKQTPALLRARHARRILARSRGAPTYRVAFATMVLLDRTVGRVLPTAPTHRTTDRACLLMCQVCICICICICICNCICNCIVIDFCFAFALKTEDEEEECWYSALGPNPG